MAEKTTKGILIHVSETTYENGSLFSTTIGIRETGFADISLRTFYGPIPSEYVGTEVYLREWNEGKDLGKGLAGLTTRLAKVTAQELSTMSQTNPKIPSKIIARHYNPRGD